MNKDLKLEERYIDGFVNAKDLRAILPEVESAHEFLIEKGGEGSDYLGWMDLPKNITPEEIKEIKETAEEFRKISDTIIVIGIGGSYLGARSAIEFLSPGAVGDKIHFVGNNLSGEYLMRHLEKIKDKEVAVNVISKSGTTTEPAIAFRVIENFLKEKYGAENIKNRIVCTTDKENGALRSIAKKEGYKSFVIPDDVGGRFSVLSPVGLFPISCAGIDIEELIKGARDQREKSQECDFDNNIAYRYAAIRNLLYRSGKKIEILSNFVENLHYISEWWKQLFGESEGKGGQGIFPAACGFSTDLHSMGQLIQDGERNIFETFLAVEEANNICMIPKREENLDGLDYLAGRDLDYVNRKAYEATQEAHFEGGVPNLTIKMTDCSPFSLGQLFYFFEIAVALSGYIQGVNPFNQPGVESYKQKMFKLLGKPGA